MAYIYLALAIITEVIATSSLKASEEFTQLWPSIIVIIGYCLSFYYLTLSLRSLPIGITYAIWSGLGIVFITAIAAFWYKQIPDIAAVIGMSFIVMGVIIIKVFSKTVES